VCAARGDGHPGTSGAMKEAGPPRVHMAEELSLKAIVELPIGKRAEFGRVSCKEKKKN